MEMDYADRVLILTLRLYADTLACMAQTWDGNCILLSELDHRLILVDKFSGQILNAYLPFLFASLPLALHLQFIRSMHKLSAFVCM